MPKVTLPSIQSGFLDTDTLNTAFQTISEAFDNTVSRDGTTPNNMDADLDMDGNRIMNIAPGVDDGDVATVGQLTELIDARATGLVIQRIVTYTAVGGETVLAPAGLTYEPGANNLAVYRDGVRLFTTAGYTETSANSITLGVAATGGQVYKFVTNEFLGSVSEATGDVEWSRLINLPDFATRWPAWGEVTGKPSVFTPDTHVHSTADITSGAGLADARRGLWVQSATPTATRVGDVWVW